MTKAEKKYLQIIAGNQGAIDTRCLRNLVSSHKTRASGMSALGGVCKVLRRLERSGLLESVSRDEYRITDKGLEILQPEKS